MALYPSLRRGPDAISPTAHYTGQVWVRHGLSHPELATWEGRLLFNALRPTMTVSRRLGGPTLEGLLLARHRVIDDLLRRVIEGGRIGQVIEPACGMSLAAGASCAATATI
jgi:O-methyltransferase involved in polyketide biosynthesis